MQTTFHFSFFFMLDFEEFAKELLTTKEVLKKIKKDLEKELQSEKLRSLQNQISSLEENIKELNKTLQKWVGPDEELKKLKELRKELTILNSLLEDTQKNLSIAFEKFKLKRNLSMLTFITIAFLLGITIGIFLNKLFNPTFLQLNGILFKKNSNCLEILNGTIKFQFEKKQFELPANTINLEICPNK